MGEIAFPISCCFGTLFCKLWSSSWDSNVILATNLVLTFGFLGWVGRLYWGPPMPHNRYAKLRNGVAIPIVILALVSVAYCAFSTDVIKARCDKTDLSCAAKSVVAFWTLLPPLWFWIEYYAVLNARIFAVPPLKQRTLISGVKNYEVYSSKVWAAFVALFLATLSARIEAGR